MSSPKLYSVTVHGCDDSTTVEIWLSEGEVRVVRELARRVTEASTYGCMPTMEVAEAPAAQQEGE